MKVPEAQRVAARLQAARRQWRGWASGIKGNRRTYAPIRQFLPDRERILGLGLNDRRNPILRHAGVLLNGARRIRTADLLGAMQGGGPRQSRQNMLFCSAFLMIQRRLQKVKYAGIRTDMQRVRHFWREVPEIRKGGWKSGRRYPQARR
jgi:hypothetical protein